MWKLVLLANEWNLILIIKTTQDSSLALITRLKATRKWSISEPAKGRTGIAFSRLQSRLDCFASSLFEFSACQLDYLEMGLLQSIRILQSLDEGDSQQKGAGLMGHIKWNLACVSQWTEAGVHGQLGLNVGIPVWWRCEQGNATTQPQRAEVSTAPVRRSSNTRADQQRNVNVRMISVEFNYSKNLAKQDGTTVRIPAIALNFSS